MPTRRGRGRKREGERGEGGAGAVQVISRKTEEEETYPIGEKAAKGQPARYREYYDPKTKTKTKYDMSDPVQAKVAMALVRGEGTKKGVKAGRKAVIGKAIQKRLLDRDELWLKWIEIDAMRDKETGRAISQNEKYTRMLQFIRVESKQKVDASVPTVRRWLQVNPPPPGWAPETFVFKKSDAFTRWDDWATPALDPTVKKRYAGTILNGFIPYWEMQGHDYAWATKSIDPMEPEGRAYWDEFIKHIKEWQYWLKSTEGGERSPVTARTMTTPVRSLLEHGTTTPAYVIKAIDVKTAGKKKFPEAIHYIRAREFERHVSLLPKPGTYLLYERPGMSKGVSVTKKNYMTIHDEEQRLMLQSAMRFSFTTGARSGALPTPNLIAGKIAYVKTPGKLAMNKNLYNNIVFGERERGSGGSAQAARGVVGMRLKDILFDASIPMIDEHGKETDIKVPIVTRIHEKMDHTWTNFPVPPKTVKAIKKYLNVRFADQMKEGETLEAFIMRYTRNRENAFTRLQQDATVDLQGHLDRNSSDIVMQKARVVWAKRLLSEYQKQLLFEYKRPVTKKGLDIHLSNPSDEFRKSTYAIFRVAVDEGRPIVDEMGQMWTPERILNNSEESPWHLYRKCYAQNMRERGMPLHVLQRYAVGWDDATTLEKYYAKIDAPTRVMWYKKIVEPTF